VLGELFRDLRYALRLAASAPAFSLAAIATLALGIGANVAVFSVVYGVLLRPLPYQDANRLIVAHADVDYVGAHRPVPVFVQPNQTQFWQRSFDLIEAPALFSMEVQALASDAGAEVIDAAIVSGRFFSTLAGPMRAGRGLEAADDATASAVISERLARRLFQDPASAVGQHVTLSSRIYTIVGVTGAEFQFPDAKRDVWLPVSFYRAAVPRCCGFQVVTRLAPGATLERARGEIAAVFAQSMPEARNGRGAVRTRVLTLRDETVAGVRPALLVLLTSVLMVLTIACSNLVNLLLARNVVREREFAIRRALGASSGRLMRQLLVETAILAAGGAICGAWLAAAAVSLLLRTAIAAVPRLDAVRVDWPVLVFAVGVAALAAVAIGVAPALGAVNAPSAPNQSVSGTATRPGRRLQRTMCVVQMAFAVILLVGATLLGRSLVRLLAADLGISTDHVLTASLNLAFGGRPRDAETLARVNRVIEEAAGLPGVRAAGVGTSLPPGPSRIRLTLRRQGDAVDYQASAVPATPGYFAALRMRLVKGRFFTDADDDRHPHVMMMSEDTARRFFGDTDPLGKTMELPVLRDGRNTAEEMTLVGIVSNVSNAGLGSPADDSVFRPFAQQAWVAPYLVVRTTGDPAEFTRTLRRAIMAADPAVVVGAIAPLDRLVAKEAAQPEFRTVLLSTFAGVALGIAIVGLYGVVSYTVSQRTREIGIRMALGATSEDVLGSVMRDGIVVAAGGIALGVVAAVALSRLLVGLLYGVAPTDPTSFVTAAAGLLGVAIVAAYIPARRAARVEPVDALRCE